MVDKRRLAISPVCASTPYILRKLCDRDSRSKCKRANKSPDGNGEDGDRSVVEWPLSGSEQPSEPPNATIGQWRFLPDHCLMQKRGLLESRTVATGSTRLSAIRKA
jgi:hypothetical protein